MHKMVFVINTSLKMKTGKIASQTAHTAVSLYLKAKERRNDDIDKWIARGQAKVVVKGLNSDHLIGLEANANLIGLLTQTIRDAGRTQIPAGSLTCLGLFGPDELVDKITGSLTLY